MRPTHTHRAHRAPWHAVVLAGGKGTRLRPLTYTRPKPLVPFMGQPYAAGLISRLAAAGCDRVTFLVGEDASAFASLGGFGAEAGVTVDVVTEERPLDTAGAARRLLAGTGERSIVVLNGDILSDVRYEDLVETHRGSGAVATLALMRVDDTSSYGVVACDDRGRVEAFLEKPAPGTTTHDTVNAGVYVLEASVFDLLPGDGPLSFERDVFPALVSSGAPVHGVIPRAHWQDLGTPERYRAGHRAVLEGRCDWPWAPGLRRVGPMAAAHRDARIHPTAVLSGPVVIGAGCRVDPGADVGDAVLFAGARVEEQASVRQAILGQESRVGARTRLEPGTVLADRSIVQVADGTGEADVGSPSEATGGAVRSDPIEGTTGVDR